MKNPLYKQKRFWIILIIIITLLGGYIIFNEIKDKQIENQKEKNKKSQGDFGWPSKTAKYITAMPVDLDQIARISKYRSCAGHIRDGYSFDKILENDRSMKHYLLPTSAYQNTNDKVEIFAPFNGIVAGIDPEKDIVASGGRANTGLGIHLSTSVDPNVDFGFGHVYLIKNFKVGDKIKAGELLGYAATGCNKGNGCDFDIDLSTPGGAHAYKDREVLGSIFDHMTNSILSEFAKYGLTKENTRVSKEYRDAHPCNYQGPEKSWSSLGNQDNPDSWISLNH